MSAGDNYSWPLIVARCHAATNVSATAETSHVRSPVAQLDTVTIATATAAARPTGPCELHSAAWDDKTNGILFVEMQLNANSVGWSVTL